MSVCLDRFAQGLPDPQAREPEIVANCSFCCKTLYDTDSFVFLDDNYYCDTYCLARYLGAEFWDGDNK